ncbi:hypothetical protein H9P43_001114 [Blastocladiella emersonii ATCC 22665]|nr:hypothetical protein H9P43_001114 [Blastocladiella emersonii ATCC 22665]
MAARNPRQIATGGGGNGRYSNVPPPPALSADPRRRTRSRSPTRKQQPQPSDGYDAEVDLVGHHDTVDELIEAGAAYRHPERELSVETDADSQSQSQPTSPIRVNHARAPSAGKSRRPRVTANAEYALQQQHGRAASFRQSQPVDYTAAWTPDMLDQVVADRAAIQLAHSGFTPIHVAPMMPPYPTYSEYEQQYDYKRPIVADVETAEWTSQQEVGYSYSYRHHAIDILAAPKRRTAMPQPGASTSTTAAVDSLTGKVAGINIEDEESPAVPFSKPAAARNKSAKPFYRDHISGPELDEGIAKGTYIVGTLRINKRLMTDAYVTADSATDDRDIFIFTQEARNRALEGDRVAIELVDSAEVLERKDRAMNKIQDRHRSGDGNGDAVPIDIAHERAKQIAEGLADDEDLDGPASGDDEEEPPLRLCGRVVAIIERRLLNLYIGYITLGRPKGQAQPSSRNSIPRRLDPSFSDFWFKPLDSKVPFLRLKKESVPAELYKQPGDYATMLFAATIDEWPADNQFPLASVTATVGQAGTMEAETKALLIGNAVNLDPFDEACLASLPETPWSISDEERARRWDFTGKNIFTIDPRTAKDLDDAVHIEPVPDMPGVYELGVHIADVSHFLEPDTALDVRASTTCTTVYLVDRAIPMLPNLLCEELCSLNPAVERLAFSVVWRIRLEDAEILDTKFGKSVIRSRAKLAYEDAQDVIEGYPLPTRDVLLADDADEATMTESIKLLYKLSRVIRRQRFDNGALTMSTVKLAFVLDPVSQMPVGCKAYEIREANQLIEEFMLLANRSVAHKIHSAFPDLALLRKHEPPGSGPMQQIVDRIGLLGYPVDASSSGALQASLEQIEDPVIAGLVRQLCVRPMKRADYVCTGKVALSDPKRTRFLSHYALATDEYTHFTSPIRRYADVIVHRQLMAALAMDADPLLTPGAVLPPNMTFEEVDRIARACNLRKMLARQAQDQSSRLYLVQYLAHLTKTAEAAADAAAGGSGEPSGSAAAASGGWRSKYNNNGKKKAPAGLVEIARITSLQDRSLEVMIEAYGIDARIFYDKLPVESFDYRPKVGHTTVVWRKSRRTEDLKVFGYLAVRIVVDVTVSPARVDVIGIDPSSEEVKVAFERYKAAVAARAKPAPKEIRDEDRKVEWLCNVVEGDE